MTKKLNDGLETLSDLKEVIITKPADVAKLPRMSSIRRLRMYGISMKYTDWRWVGAINNLEEIELTVGDDSEVLRAGKELIGSLGQLAVANKQIEINMQLAETAKLFSKVLDNLPPYLRTKVCSKAFHAYEHYIRRKKIGQD